MLNTCLHHEKHHNFKTLLSLSSSRLLRWTLLLLFTREELEYLDLTSTMENPRSEQERLLPISDQESADSKSSCCGSFKNPVTIFSREDESCYNWLLRSLRRFYKEAEVKTFFISNNSSWTLRIKASSCHFAILYHTKNRGRVNVCDVTDALYDKELETLSKVRGKENVMVVIDDLDDPGPDLKATILQNQPKLKVCAEYVNLFGREETKETREMEDIIKRTVARSHNEYKLMIRLVSAGILLVLFVIIVAIVATKVMIYW
uniref:Uncharacterized protein n=1 Tax=Leptobrachium leishanense TaxID=445787 RepID=A0A8C5QMA1_9ANUR